MTRTRMTMLALLIAAFSGCGAEADEPSEQETTNNEREPLNNESSGCDDVMGTCFESLDDLEVRADLFNTGESIDETEDISGELELNLERDDLELTVRCQWDGWQPTDCLDTRRVFPGSEDSPIRITGKVADEPLNATSGVVSFQMEKLPNEDPGTYDEYEVTVTIDDLIVTSNGGEEFVISSGIYDGTLTLDDAFVNYDG